jgi:hypothetical protein
MRDWRGEDNLTKTGIQFTNYIDSIGCNIIGLKQIKSAQEHLYNGNTKQFLLDLEEDLKELLNHDYDYSQLAIIQVRKQGTTQLREDIRDHFKILFESNVRGGHGNAPLVIMGIDLAELRKEGN